MASTIAINARNDTCITLTKNEWDMRDFCIDCPFKYEGTKFHCPEEEGYLCPHLAMKNGYNPAKLGGG